MFLFWRYGISRYQIDGLIYTTLLLCLLCWLTNRPLFNLLKTQLGLSLSERNMSIKLNFEKNEQNLFYEKWSSICLLKFKIEKIHFQIQLVYSVILDYQIQNFYVRLASVQSEKFQITSQSGFLHLHCFWKSYVYVVQTGRVRLDCVGKIWPTFAPVKTGLIKTAEAFHENRRITFVKFSSKTSTGLYRFYWKSWRELEFWCYRKLSKRLKLSMRIGG